MIDQIIQDLMLNKGYTEQQANKILFTKGLENLFRSGYGNPADL